jgi:2C-methyl-D-erythritol 2,4-cyclodiphosphate synthase
MTNPKYPEHDKLHAVVDRSQEVGQFLEWMQEQGWHFCKSVKYDEFDEPQLAIQYLNITKTLAEYFHIDLDKIEAEKRAMLDELSRLGQEQG